MLGEFLSKHSSVPLLAKADDPRLTLLGSGSYGEVYKFEDPKGEDPKGEDPKRLILAIKLYKCPHRNNISYFIREQLRLLPYHNLPNIPQIYGKILVLYNYISYTGLCMEYVPGIDLFERKLLTMTDEFLLPILRQILTAVAALHSADMVHRDIKPENIRVDLTTGRSYLLDFEFITRRSLIRDQKIVGLCGTPIYGSPELYSQIRIIDGDTPSTFEFDTLVTSDVWALGMSFYFVLHRDEPFEGSDWTDIRPNILADKRKPLAVPAPPGTEKIQKIIDSILVPADRRPTARELLATYF